MPEAYIYEALRTPRGRGKSQGALYEVKPIDLLSATLNALRQRASIAPGELDDTVIGCVTPIDDQGYNVAKAALLHTGWGEAVSGMQVNRYCASGLEAVNLAAMKVRSGWEGLVLAGGSAKGFAHIGVLKVLEEVNMPIDYVTGTSMGAIVGGLFAIGYY